MKSCTTCDGSDDPELCRKVVVFLDTFFGALFTFSMTTVFSFVFTIKRIYRFYLFTSIYIVYPYI